MTTRSSFGIALVTISLGTTGCMGQLATEGAHVDAVSGALGDVDVSGTPEVREVSLRDDALYIELRREDGLGNFAMIGITIPHDGEAARVGGAVLALRPENAELIGCSGPGDGDWEFDCTPDEYTVEILNKADRMQVDFTGEFDCDNGEAPPAEDPTVGGSVDVDLI